MNTKIEVSYQLSKYCTISITIKRERYNKIFIFNSLTSNTYTMLNIQVKINTSCRIPSLTWIRSFPHKTPLTKIP